MKTPSITAIIVTIIILIFIGFIAFEVNNSPSNSYAAMSSRELSQVCMASEGNVLHIHSHLTIIANKQTINLPAEIGVDQKNSCIYPLHTHDGSNIIHVESPVQKDFTLSDFFALWNMPLNKQQILNYKVDANHGLKLYVNGNESNDLEYLILKDHQDIVIDYYNLNDGQDPLPKPFDWSSTNV